METGQKNIDTILSEAIEIPSESDRQSYLQKACGDDMELRREAERLTEATRACLHGFIGQAVEPGSVVHTDGLHAYRGLEKLGYGHEVSVLLGAGAEAATRLLPRVHRVASLLKRWLLGTHQGAVSVEHLDYYLDEYTFRFNRRKSASRGKLFYRLLQQAVQIDPVPYSSIVGGKENI